MSKSITYKDLHFLFHTITGRSNTEALAKSKTSGQFIQSTEAHRHPFWQFELIDVGSLVLRSSDYEQVVGVNQLLLIPPGTVHSFYYPEPNRTLSIKFSADIPIANQIKICECNESALVLKKLLFDLIYSQAVLGSEQKAIVEVNLPFLLRSFIVENNLKSGNIENEFLCDKVSAYVLKKLPERVTLTDVANDLGYSVSHLSRLFREEKGESLKNFMNKLLAEQINYHLIFSDLSLIEIASYFQFSDVYSFGKFFKRFFNVSPGVYRKRKRAIARAIH